MTPTQKRLKAKLLATRLPTREQFDAMVAKEMADKLLASKVKASEEEDYFTWHDGRHLPVQSLLLEVLYDLIQRDPNIESLSLQMKDGKKLELSWGL